MAVLSCIMLGRVVSGLKELPADSSGDSEQ